MHKNLVRLQLVLVAVCGVLMLNGCKEDDRRAALRANPEITDIGEFDGCSVRYVNRGTHGQSFYLAKCDAPSSTVTNNYETPAAKFRYSDPNVTYPDQNVTIQKNPGAQAVSNVLESQKEKLRQQEIFLDQQYKKLQEAKKLLESVEASQVGR